MLGVLLVLQVSAIILAVIFDVQVTESIVSRITRGRNSETESYTTTATFGLNGTVSSTTARFKPGPECQTILDAAAAGNDSGSTGG